MEQRILTVIKSRKAIFRSFVHFGLESIDSLTGEKLSIEMEVNKYELLIGQFW